VKSDPTFWIAARATGITAYAMLTCSVLAGLVLKSRPFARLKASTVTDLHRFLALLALGAVAVHGIALVMDETVTITFKALFVPGEIPYRPLWTGIGVVGAELAFLIYVSFSLRKLIGVKNWRRLHWATYIAFALVTAHGLMAGSDSHLTWAHWLYLGAIGAVLGATAYRALAPPQSRRGRPSGRPAAESRAEAVQQVPTPS
jgi:methionine sulfoxide reductase heme-binding subunit